MFVAPRVCVGWMRPSFRILQDRKNRFQGTPVSQENIIPPLPAELFNKQSFELLVRLKYAFISLQNFDPNIQKVSSRFGAFIFQAVQPIHTLFYTSPFSGVFKYYYDVDSRRWVSNKDRHILEENLSRETNKYFKGYLDI